MQGYMPTLLRPDVDVLRIPFSRLGKPYVGAPTDGGRIVFEGTPAELVAARATPTGEHLAASVGAAGG